MIEAPEAVGDIALDEPVRPRPGVGHLRQCGVTAPAGSESAGAVAEHRLVVRLRQQAHHPPNDLVAPCRQIERALLP